MPGIELLTGPLLRRVVGTRATIWVETSAPATVTVRTPGPAGGVARTFSAFGHHYALVVVEGLVPGAETAYEVLLDGKLVWPVPELSLPPSRIRTRSVNPHQPVQVAFGSCRLRNLDRPPADAVSAYARRLIGDPAAEAPDLLVMLGDQIYADLPPAGVRRFLGRRANRAVDAPPDEVVSFAEYAQVYRESWTEPEFRWLLSVVPTVMMFDDHDVINNWNTSAPWLAEMQTKPWWHERLSHGLAAYWVYQHLGNLAPGDLAADPLFQAVLATSDDAAKVLTDQLADQLADRLTGQPTGPAGPGSSAGRHHRWSYRLDVGRTRIVMLDDRSGRQLGPANRAMIHPGDWAWFLDQLPGDYDHLVIGASLPWLLPPTVHHGEGIAEHLSGSGRPGLARFGDRLRQVGGLDHWAGFRGSFEALSAALTQIGGLATISVLSGDVHHSYVARVSRPSDSVPLHQLTSSGFLSVLSARDRGLLRIGWWKGPTRAAGLAARVIGVPRSGLTWEKRFGPYFGTAISTLRHVGEQADVVIEGPDQGGRLWPVGQVVLNPGGPHENPPDPAVLYAPVS